MNSNRHLTRNKCRNKSRNGKYATRNSGAVLRLPLRDVTGNRIAVNARQHELVTGVTDVTPLRRYRA